MKDKSKFSVCNDSDLGYFDDFFVEEIRNEIRDTLIGIDKEKNLEVEIVDNSVSSI